MLLAGPDGTPFSDGIFHLELTIPTSYPAAPPTAHFRTKIFHPNVDPATGAVCVDTLKRDWKPELTLRDILVTIYCLLACPNAASALNEEAGMLIDEDYAAFERRANLWSTMYAAVPRGLKPQVIEAKTRGETKPTETAQGTKRPQKRLRQKAEDVFQLDSETAENPKPGKLGFSGPSSFLREDNNVVSESPAVHGLGLHLQSSKTADDMDVDTTLTQAAPSAKVCHPRRRYKLNAPPAFKNAVKPSSSRPLATVAASMLNQPSAAADAPAARQPEAKRIRLTPPHQLSTRASGFGTRFGSPSKITRQEAHPWLEWHRKIASTPESRSARESRELFERKRMHAAGGCITKYNSGAFGPKVGIMRL